MSDTKDTATVVLTADDRRADETAMEYALRIAATHGWSVATNVVPDNTTMVGFQRTTEAGEELMSSAWVTSTGQLDWADYAGPNDPDGVFTPHYAVVVELLSSAPAFEVQA